MKTLDISKTAESPASGALQLVLELSANGDVTPPSHFFGPVDHFLERFLIHPEDAFIVRNIGIFLRRRVARLPDANAS